VPAATVATDFDIPLDYEETTQADTSLPSEQARFQPRFRVVTRKPLPLGKAVRVSPFSGAMVFAAVPALALLAYVVSWTLVMYGGYQKSALRGDIARLQIERAELQAKKREGQAPGRVLEAARRLGMQPAERRQFVQLPASEIASAAAVTE
jgi:hypothetical protein